MTCILVKNLFTVFRATFELATFFDSCVGLDITTKYARVGACLREGAAVQYAMPLEGELETFHTVDLKAFGLDHVAQRTDFLQADVNNLDPKYSQYDFILASNILEFLYDPALFLSSVHERLRPHGVLCVCSKYEWDVNFTPREKWLSGFKQVLFCFSPAPSQS
jgi:SAM-dependent methyltransferase